jgi:hypothetical protein
MRLFMALLTLLFLSGCESITATRSLASLQTEFGAIVRTQNDCNKAETAAEACFGDFETMHGSIESQARTAIEGIKDSTDLGDRQITIGLYRLAAFASLQANTHHASDYADAGSQLCAALGNAEPPRDCALLAVVGQYEVLKAFDADVRCLGTPGCTPNKNAEELASGFCKTFDTLASKTTAAQQQALLPATVNTYLGQQVVAAVESMHAFAAQLTPSIFGDQPRKPCDCVNLDSTDPAFATKCGNVPPGTQMATFKAMCISDNLDATSRNCHKF